MRLTIKQINAARPCAESGKRVRKLLRAYNPAKDAEYSAADAKAAGCTFDDVAWIASAAARKDPAVERAIRLWLADCAARVLHIFERYYPSDARPRDAIKATRDFANGKIDDAAWAAAWDAARAAARDAARAAARAAAWDTAGAAAGDTAWAAAGAAARDAARAAARAAAGDTAGDAEEEWQFNRLCAWLSEKQPRPLALPKRGAA